MPLSEDVLERAARGKRQAIIDTLAHFYPSIYRISSSLSGRPDVAEGVVKYVMKQAIGQIAHWRDPDDAERWFNHHTILTLRRAARHTPELTTDPLIVGANTKHAYYPAFIRAVRALPIQQREAFLLHHGESFGQRLLATAMDCSSDAANNHLREANTTLKKLAGDQFMEFVNTLKSAHEHVTPTRELVLGNVSMRVRRYLFPRRLIRAVRLVLFLTVIVAIGLFVWKVYPILKY
jgi:DNA-directed RNA polymerase specialized sigma24 family protein